MGLTARAMAISSGRNRTRHRPRYALALLGEAGRRGILLLAIGPNGTVFISKLRWPSNLNVREPSARAGKSNPSHPAYHLWMSACCFAFVSAPITFGLHVLGMPTGIGFARRQKSSTLRPHRSKRTKPRENRVAIRRLGKKEPRGPFGIRAIAQASASPKNDGAAAIGFTQASKGCCALVTVPPDRISPIDHRPRKSHHC
jgi:hypothetical protein